MVTLLKRGFGCTILYYKRTPLPQAEEEALSQLSDSTVSVRLEEDGRIATGQSADTDTVVASVKAYVNALNRLIVRRTKSAPDSDVKQVNYRDAS